MVSSRPISLYLHVPFCTVRCSYCDFNTYANLEALIPAWETALLSELRLWAPLVAGRLVPTVFIGGGTPSLLEGEAIGRILDIVRERYALNADAEITLEANPESVSVERLRAYRAAGVNRLSIGVQSLDEGELHFLDRLHDGEGARRAVAAARAAGFDNVNVDLIFGLPGQPSSGWERTLEGAIAMEPDHVSCYALTVEEGTPLAARVASGSVAEADPDVAAEMGEATEQRLSAAGYAQYEISNYARPGKACRHNLVYWRHDEYLGLGPGAHGFVDGVRYAVERSPGRYIGVLRDGSVALRQAGLVPRSPFDRLRMNGGQLPSPAVVSREEVDEETAALDTLTLGLRLNEGVVAAEFARRYPTAWERYRPAVEWSKGVGLAEEVDGRLRLTSRGRRLSNEVFVRLLEPSLV